MHVRLQKPVENYKKIVVKIQNGVHSFNTPNFVGPCSFQFNCSYLVVEIYAKNMKSHTEADKIILLFCNTTVRTKFGTDAENEDKKILFSIIQSTKELLMQKYNSIKLL